MHPLSTFLDTEPSLAHSEMGEKAVLGLRISQWKRREFIFQELGMYFVRKLYGVKCHLYA